MIPRLKHHFLPLTLLFVLTIIIHHSWFFKFSPIVWGDSYLDFAEKIKEFFGLPQTWYGDVAFGSLNIGISFWPFIFLTGILNQLGLEPVISQRILALWPIAIFTPIFMYCLAYYLLRSRIGALLAGIVYLFNVPFIIGRSGILTLSIAVAISPIFILFYLITLMKKRVFYLIITALIGYVISFYEFRLFYMVALILALYTLYHFFIIEKFRYFRLVLKTGAIFFSVIMLVFLLNFYFILGLSSIGSITKNAVFDRPLIGQNNVNLLHSFLLYFRLWTGQSFDKVISYNIVNRFFIIPVIAFLGFYVSRKNKFVPFFAALSLLGIFLTKQEAAPFKDIYKWLFDNIPGFNAFRESSKFYFYIALGYSILIGAFTREISRLIKTEKLNRKIILIIIFISVAGLFLWNAKPILTGKLGYMFIPRKIPKEYITLKDYVFNQNEFFRIFWIPHPSHWGAYSNLHPKISNWDIIAYDWKKFSSGGLFDPLNQKYSNQLFDVSSIKYVVIPLDDPKNADDFFDYMGKRGIYVTGANKIEFLKRIYIPAGDIAVFENFNYRPHIYATDGKETITRYIPFQKTEFKFIHTTEYKISIKNLYTSLYLNFSENFHPDWKLRLGEFSWYKVLTEKNYFLPEKLHFENDAGFNSFYLNPKTICQQFSTSSCMQNSNGSYDINLTLYFRPQSYVYLGLIVSAIVFFTCIAYLSFALLKMLA